MSFCPLGEAAMACMAASNQHPRDTWLTPLAPSFAMASVENAISLFVAAVRGDDAAAPVAEGAVDAFFCCKASCNALRPSSVCINSSRLFPLRLSGRLELGTAATGCGGKSFSAYTDSIL